MYIKAKNWKLLFKWNLLSSYITICYFEYEHLKHAKQICSVGELAFPPLFFNHKVLQLPEFLNLLLS